jgi:hypothetical protein
LFDPATRNPQPATRNPRLSTTSAPAPSHRDYGFYGEPMTHSFATYVRPSRIHDERDSTGVGALQRQCGSIR